MCVLGLETELIAMIRTAVGAVSYSNDASSQLTNEQRTGTDAFNTTYSYDPLGNRLLQTANGLVTTRTSNAANAQMVSISPSGARTTSTFDANGNLLQENTGGALVSYSWDPENRLLSYESAAANETYQYSQDGLRKKKVNSSGTA
jgi:YD repeat-containing protein